jgi:hypothetical protein
MWQIVVRAGEAALVMICHAFLGGVTVTCIWLMQHLIDNMWSGKVLIWGTWPLEYFFQTIEISIAIVVAIFGLWETIETLKRKF